MLKIMICHTNNSELDFNWMYGFQRIPCTNSSIWWRKRKYISSVYSIPFTHLLEISFSALWYNSFITYNNPKLRNSYLFYDYHYRYLQPLYSSWGSTCGKFHTPSSFVETSFCDKREALISLDGFRSHQKSYAPLYITMSSYIEEDMKILIWGQIRSKWSHRTSINKIWSQTY